MEKTLTFDNKKFLSSKAAAKKSAFTHDYISRLCRLGKLEGRKVANSWYVAEDSLNQFLAEQLKDKEKRSSELREQRKKEYEASQSLGDPITPETKSAITSTVVAPTTDTSGDAPLPPSRALTKVTLALPVPGTFFKRLSLVAVVFFAVVGFVAVGAPYMHYAEDGYNTVRTRIADVLIPKNINDRIASAPTESVVPVTEQVNRSTDGATVQAEQNLASAYDIVSSTFVELARYTTTAFQKVRSWIASDQGSANTTQDNSNLAVGTTTAQGSTTTQATPDLGGATPVAVATNTTAQAPVAAATQDAQPTNNTVAVATGETRTITPVTKTPTDREYLSIGTSVEVNNNIVADGNLSVGGSAVVNGGTTVGGALSAQSNATVGGGLQVTGPSTLFGQTQAFGGVNTFGADVNAGQGRVFASNIINSLQAGSNITISGDPANPTISSSGGSTVISGGGAGVFSLQGQRGALTLSAGDDISIGGLTISNASTLDSVRSRGGCTDCITDGDVANDLTISGGTIDGTPIGSTTASTAIFTIATSTDLIATSTLAVGTTSAPLATGDIYGNLILSGANRYINFDYSTSTSGYGFRDNSGTIQVKNSGGSWVNLGSGGAFSSALGSTTLNTISDIVGIGTTSPLSKVDIYGDLILSGTDRYLNFGGTATGTTGYGFRDNAGTLQVKNSGGSWVNLGSGGAFSSSNGSTTLNTGSDFVGIGTTSPYAKLSVVGEAVAEYFTATSTTATTTLWGGLSVDNGLLEHNFSTGITSISSLEAGSISFGTNAGTISWTDLPVTSSAAAGTKESYTAQIDGQSLLTVYAESDGAGSIQNTGVGIGTTTPTLLTNGSSTLAVNGLLYVGGDIAGTSTIEHNLHVLGTLRASVSYVGDLVFGNNFRFTEGNYASSTQRLFLKNQYGTTTLTVEDNGRIGIGTTTPQYDLHVIGDVAAQSFVNISTKDEKKDIVEVQPEEKQTILETIENTMIAHYRYNTEDETAPLRIGLIAENAPAQVLSVSGRGVDIYKLTAFTLAGVQELAVKVNNIDTRVTALENLLASTTVATSTASVSQQSLAGMLGSWGISIKNGITHIVDLAVDTLTVGSAQKPSGITLYDESTGAPYCVRIRNGAMVNTAGACGVSGAAVSGTNGTADTEPPTITLLGNNPAQIAIGATYADPGVTVDDNVNKNLGYKVAVNGVDVQNINLDTSTSTTYTITFSATDQAGNVGSAQRTVIIGNGGTQQIQNNTQQTATTTPSTTATSTTPITMATSTPPADTTAPIITLTGSSTVDLIVGDTYADLGATATDDTDGDITAQITVNNPVDTTTVGSYTVRYNVADVAGNQATEVTRTVNVVAAPADTTPPTITLLGGANFELYVGDTFTDPGATATDDTDGDISSSVVVSGSVDTATVGVYTLTYNVADAAGNHATEVIRTVTVNSVPAPTQTASTTPQTSTGTSTPVTQP